MRDSFLTNSSVANLSKRFFIETKTKDKLQFSVHVFATKSIYPCLKTSMFKQNKLKETWWHKLYLIKVFLVTLQCHI